MNKKNNNVDVEKIITEIKAHLNNGSEMTYVKSLNIDENYKEKEIKKAIRQTKKQKLNIVLENLNDSPESVILESVLDGMSEYYNLNLAREVQKM